MLDKITPSLTEFGGAVRAMCDCPDVTQVDAFAAGRSVEQIKPRSLKTRRMFEDTTSKGWPL